MSIKHFVDLPVSKIRALIDSDQWIVSEKYDGSYIRAGIDANGFYTSRKGTRVYRKVTDWDDKPWTNAFRAAHIVLEEFLEHKEFEPGEYVDVEIINGSNPNTIVYSFDLENSLVILNTNKPAFRITNRDFHHQIATVTTNEHHWVSHDGITLQKVIPPHEERSWAIVHNHKRPLMLDFRANYGFLQFLNRYIMVRGALITNGDLLETKLNVTPTWWNNDVGEFSENRADNIAHIRERRAEVRQQFETLYEDTARSLIQIVHPHRSHIGCEGVVCDITLSDGTTEMVKFVPRSTFRRANTFSHIVRYWLQGGRRPERPSFVSRTAHWPVEKRLARLEQLRKRYLEHNNKLEYEIISYKDGSQLNARTLALFAELRERIQNGWTGV